MTKITMIGAGSAGFCRMLTQDILCFESMKDAHFALFDIDEKRLKTTFEVMQKMKEQNNLNCTFTATTDRKSALKDAKFAISMIQVGGLEPYQLDIDIPLKYGVDQCVGDTINPGGIFRGLRHVPALLDILKDMEEVCPDVIFMNYANPMAICSWAMQKEFPHIQSVGLCHGIQHTTTMLCDWLGVKKEECEISVAGINHMAWFLEFLHNGKDLYPAIWDKIENEGAIHGEDYRFEMFKAVGYFMTESPGHLSEYLPYFRKRKELMDMFSGNGFSGATAAYLNFCKAGLENYNKEMADYESGSKPIPYEQGNKSVEYAADIMNAKITGNIFKLFGNILNKGFISNLPNNCCVEVPIFVDKFGMHGAYVGELPKQCAALNMTNILVQDLAVDAAIYGDYERVYQACMMDPLTAAVLAPHEIRNMVDEMIESQREWLPQFKNKKNQYPGAYIGRLDNDGKNIKKGVVVERQIGHYDKAE